MKKRGEKDRDKWWWKVNHESAVFLPVCEAHKERTSNETSERGGKGETNKQYV